MVWYLPYHNVTHRCRSLNNQQFSSKILQVRYCNTKYFGQSKYPIHTGLSRYLWFISKKVINLTNRNPSLNLNTLVSSKILPVRYCNTQYWVIEIIPSILGYRIITLGALILHSTSPDPCQCPSLVFNWPTNADIHIFTLRLIILI